MCEHDHIPGRKLNTEAKRKGASLKNKEAHEEDHNQWSRRDFLSSCGLFSAGAMILGNQAFANPNPSPLLASLGNGESDRVLVLIRLKGGNDGLNTTILRGNDDYYNLRPNIAVQESGLWSLDSDVGMPNSMQSLESHWDNGDLAVIHSVGYPDQNYSHFRSSDIWASASDSQVIDDSGWMGRFLDSRYPAFLETPPTVPPALQIGVQANLVFKSDQYSLGLAISNPTEFYQLAATGQLYSTAGLGDCARDLELGFLRQTANNAFRYSEAIRDAYNRSQSTVNYPVFQNDLSEQLAIVARMIKGRLGTKIYMVSIDGFDTHADQVPDHDNLLQSVADGVNAFFQDLATTDDENRVIAMTFSEFGRTAHENDSGGTDHAAAAPVMLFGPNVYGGMFGTLPDLANIEYGDYAFTTDFRSIYATMLQDWLCVEPELVDYTMGKEFSRINNLVDPCLPSQGLNDAAALLGHNRDKNDSSKMQIKYSLKERGEMRLQILTTGGHPIRVLEASFKESGSYIFEMNPYQLNLPPGDYMYRLDFGGKRYQRGILL